MNKQIQTISISIFSINEAFLVSLKTRNNYRVKKKNQFTFRIFFRVLLCRKKNCLDLFLDFSQTFFRK